ncbi:methyl-accepting chemotaxis protein [Pseudoalteromonas sp. MMG010]|uniref:methyl-accepting chemotaxis protein n=1 Tax=Pseudoalteromonas sp. MMG010 TaxID=2822685 RepID=UPI001B3A5827|nr:methyl-accepting chemotaxis protein [Pseudoalteromonas sp. MMG010]MBQ4832093.1 methyl-accepting chemotaxis protein [Pseudoalteromonas sp. MMG010]
MNNLFNLRLNSKLTLLFLIVGILPALILLIISTKNSSSDITNKVGSSLTAINNIKKESIERYFAERQGDMSVLVEIASAFKSEAFAKLNAVNTVKSNQLHDYFNQNKQQLHFLASQSIVKQALTETSQTLISNRNQWLQVLDKYDQTFKPILDGMQWYDLFLVNMQGDIVYSVTRENDLEQNLNKQLKSTSFGSAFAKAQSLEFGQIAFGDYQPYGPSADAPAAFFVTPVMSGSKKIGYVAFQQPIEKVNEILGNRMGLGKTGESYLVGFDGLMRSDSYLNPTDYSVLASFSQNNKVDTLAIKSAKQGTAGTEIILDYNNNPVVSSWDIFTIDADNKWAIISEVDVAEAFNPKINGSTDFYASYIKEYGYYDLFLINTDGYIFYTVTKEDDYQTNIISGKYAESNLGTLIKNIKTTKAYGLTDFAPYAPSNNAPAAFIAQPILNDEGNADLYIALQLPLEGIQNIMSIRAGMGETGESYLVGQDNRMRSNSFLDPTGHSVAASFSGTVAQNGVDSDATRQALLGHSGTRIITDYNGNPVLSSYDAIEFGQFKWAIMSEIDEAEAFAELNANRWFSIILIIVASVIILIVARLIAKKISTPIIKISQVAEEISNGNLQFSVQVDQNDEVGDLQIAINSMRNKLKAIVSNIAQQAHMQAATSEELAAITTQTSATVVEQQSMTEQLATAMEEMGATVKDIASSASNTSMATNDGINLIDNGLSHIDSTYEQINLATAQMARTETSVNKVKDEFKQVTNVLNVIIAISEQTNLLALNAAIEAARAGEMGRGFAVVADEVRQLAQRTQASTAEIEAIISSITSIIDESVTSMADSVTLTEKVLQYTESTRTIEHEIASKMQLVLDSATQVATATEEQSVVIEEILQNVHAINIGINETSQATSEIAQSSNSTAEVASAMQKEISIFKVD